MLDSQFLGDRQGILRRASTFEVIDADFGHEGEVAAEGEWSRGVAALQFSVGSFQFSDLDCGLVEGSEIWKFSLHS